MRLGNCARKSKSDLLPDIVNLEQRPSGGGRPFPKIGTLLEQLLLKLSGWEKRAWPVVYGMLAVLVILFAQVFG